MSMNIKNEKAHRLAQEVAKLTGETLTEAVTVALEERLDRLIPAQASEVDRKLARMRQLVEEMQPYTAGMPGSADIDGFLYDQETGLPK